LQQYARVTREVWHSASNNDIREVVKGMSGDAQRRRTTMIATVLARICATAPTSAT